MSHVVAAGPAALALEADALRAGCAMACAFSSSDELYAAVVSERRAAGFYGPRRHMRDATAIGCGIVVLAIVLLAVV